MKSKKARNKTRKLMTLLNQKIFIVATCEMCDRVFVGENFYALVLIRELNIYECVNGSSPHPHIVCEDCRDTYEKANEVI